MTRAQTFNQVLEGPGDGNDRQSLAQTLLEYVRQRRWYRAKSRSPRRAEVQDLIQLDAANVLAILRIEYELGEPDIYAVPLAHLERQDASGALGSSASAGGSSDDSAPAGTIVSLGDHARMVDGLMNPGHAADILLQVIREGRSLPGKMNGRLLAQAMPQFADVAPGELPPATLPRVEQTNSTAIFGDRVLLKIYRQLSAGPNPELEVGRFLTTHCQPPCAPRVLGSLSYVSADRVEYSLGIAHEFLANQGDAFTLALEQLRAYFAEVAPEGPSIRFPPPGAVRPASGGPGLLARAIEPESAIHVATVPSLEKFVGRATTLGRRTGELHLALAGAGATDDDFSSVPLSADDRAQLVTRADGMWKEQAEGLTAALPRLAPGVRLLAERLLAPAARGIIAAKLTQFLHRAIDVVKTRTHGDLHLGQVLVRGEDFVIIDFEGEPARPLGERRAKSSPIRDVMGMVRSFDYAPEVLMRDKTFEQTFVRGSSGDQSERRRSLNAWAALWKQEVSAAYLRGYLSTVAGAAFVPVLPLQRDQLALLLTFYELEKVIYEIGYEVNNRPDWVEIPLRGLAAVAGLEEVSP